MLSKRAFRRSAGCVPFALAALLLAGSAMAQTQRPPPAKKAAPAPAAGIFGKDERRPPPARYASFAKSVAQLETRAGNRVFYCTGFCVADNVVATASHCVTVPEVRDHVHRTAIAVGQGADRRLTNIAGRSREATPWNIVVGSSRIQTRGTSTTFAHDWALLRTAAPVCQGRVLPVMGPADLPSSWQQALASDVFALGFHHDTGTKSLRLSDACAGPGTTFELALAQWIDAESEAQNVDLLPHRCDAAQGSSGAPLFIETKGGTRVAGVMVAVQRVVNTKSVSPTLLSHAAANRAVLAAAFRDKIALASREPETINKDSLMVLQGALKARGYLPADAAFTGAFDLPTRQAIIDFERAQRRLVVGRPTAELVALATSQAGLPPARRPSAVPDRATIDRIIAGTTRALALDPSQPYLYSRRGDVLAETNQADAALADYTQAIALDARYAPARFGRGLLRLRSGDLQGAGEDFDVAISAQPRHAGALNNRGLAFARAGDLDRAIEHYSRALEADPKFATALRNRAEAWQAKREPDKALADLDAALVLDPGNPWAHNQRGIIFARKGDYRTAIEAHGSALALSPDYGAAFRARGNARAETGDYRGAAADYDEAIRVDPTDAEALHNRGWIHRRNGARDKAIADFDRAIEIAPKYQRAWRHRADTRLEGGDLPGAIKDYTEAVRLDPRDADALNNRGWARLSVGQRS
ncbi:MAG: tetratricopeptide repeat protein, partial [Hyphomicrobiales bacterium]|nr:tetratricopeptide repeat protein [Hyphomicrobiales bacterium]